MNDLRALVPVGQLLGQELEVRGWTQADFAAVLGRPTQFVSEIVTGKKEITRESAAQIGAALGLSAEFWLSLQDAYLLGEQAEDLAIQRNLVDVRRRARLNQLAPVGLLMKRGVLRGRTLDELEAEVMDLFELSSIEDEPAFSIAARRSNDDEPVSPVQLAWVACVRRGARARTGLKAFSKKKLVDLADGLPGLLRTPQGFLNLPELFAAAGVRLVYVEALPGARIDGCSFFLDKTPVIGLSGRGKRLDKVLFTLLHEVAHIVLGHVAHETIVESTDDHDEPNSNEVDANKVAGDWLLPSPLPPAPQRVGAGWVEYVANDLGLAPIVVVGQLQNRGILEWRSTLAKNAPTVSAQLEAW